MMQKHSLRVIPDEQTDETPTQTQDVQSYYDEATTVELQDYVESRYSLKKFLDAVIDRIGLDHDASSLRLVDELEPSEDIDMGVLLALPDDGLLFVGADPTAKDAIPWFTFHIGPAEPVPAPDTASAALDLLKPPAVQDLVVEEAFLPRRHGEWWLLPCQLVPAGTIFNPGLGERPYGPSPLGNHVPREYAFTVSDSEFMDRFQASVESAPGSIESPPEAIAWTWRQLKKVNPPEGVPSWADIRSFAGDVIVRGSIRHRDDDHYAESVETWHRAITHDFEVYTADQVANDVHLDYHGV